jgi:galactose oxidase
MSTVSESGVNACNIAGRGAGNAESDRHPVESRRRTGTLTPCKTASILLALSATCYLATIQSTEAQTTNEVILINRNSGQCVTVPNGSTQSGVQMVQRPCQGPPDEQWTLQAVSGGYRIMSSVNGLCLEVAGASTADNAAVQQSTCTSSPSKTWKKKVSGSWSQLVAQHSGKCMAISGASRDEGARVVQIRCSSAAEKRWTISGSPLPSLWSPKITFTIVPAAAANMADGRLLLWSAYGRFYFGGNHGETYTVIYDPVSGSATERLVSNTGHDMFCPGTSMLPDGRILVNGGSSSNRTSIFNPASGTWSQSQQMVIPRGYNGNTVLSTGAVLTLGGSWSGGEGNKHAEVWSSGNGWRRLSGVPVNDFIGPDPKGVYRGDNHMWLIAASNGWVFHAGPSVQMHWIDTNGSGGLVAAGPRGDDAYAMNGNAIEYDTGRILKLGGAPRYDNGKATDGAYVIDIRGGPEAPVSVRKVAPMAFPRTLSNSVVLPNGQVVVVGGMNISKVFSDLRPVYMAELWDPQTETFTRLSAMTTPRTYHGVALLMLDGRVFVGGGGLCTDGYSGTCNNHPDAEILTPPYLLNADGTLAARPSITSAPASAAPGTTITVRTDTNIAAFDLIRMAAATHSVNNDQRRIPLPITSGNQADGYRLHIPADRGDVLPGNYMLFALNASGRPSVAKVVQIR